MRSENVLKVLATLVLRSDSMSIDSEGVTESPQLLVAAVFLRNVLLCTPLGLELMTCLLLQPPKYWDYEYESP